ncbi:hypothetical protein [Paenibacillus sp. FSL H3-0333]|uniref:hypothetical protein n=1 Tax=Paenibacillus sp. FSL H3-0333 TaxID=2921373 RepID=UPI0030F902BB
MQNLHQTQLNDVSAKLKDVSEQKEDDDQVDKVKIVHTKDNSLLDGFMKDNKNYICVNDLKEKWPN